MRHIAITINLTVEDSVPDADVDRLAEQAWVQVEDNDQFPAVRGASYEWKVKWES